jgi:hypothetical protein
MEDEEYMKRVRERFYKQVRETRWGDDSDERPKTTKGRKPKPHVRHESRPRTIAEQEATGSKQKYKWFTY